MQRYLWQQANGRRHAYDHTQHTPAAGETLPTACGRTVTPRADEIDDGDLPVWLDPTCLSCERAAAIAAGWSPAELAVLREHRRAVNQ